MLILKIDATTTKANVAASINRNEFEVLKDYVDAISKSRSGDFRSRKRWKGEGT